jgi:probable F420-dependent oxidoreductase
MAVVSRVAKRAEALGFADLWVTENLIDEAYSFDPLVILTYAAAITSRIRLATSVMILPVRTPIHVAAGVGSLDYVSGGRAILGVGIGRDEHYEDYQVPPERKVRRFLEAIEVIKALWTQDSVTYHGDFYHLENKGIALKPVQKPHPPIWGGGVSPGPIRRAARIADGWLGSGGQTSAAFLSSVELLRRELDAAGRDPATFGISKRVFIAVDTRRERAREDLLRWFGGVYHKPEITDSAGVWGTPSEVEEQLEALAASGCGHLLLNPVARYEEQLEGLAAVVGLR